MKLKPKTFAFFVEPSSYTLDLIEHVHIPMGINYAFLNEQPLIAKGTDRFNAPSLEKMSILQKIHFLKKIIRNYDFFIFNGYSTKDFLLFYSLFLRENEKFLALESDTPLKLPNGLRGVIKTFYLGHLFQRANILGFAGGSGKHRELFSHYGMDSERIFTLPMMVNNARFYRHPENMSSMSPFIFLYVGRIVPHKNVRMMIESFLSIFAKNKNFLLRIVGKGEDLPSLKQRYAQHSNIIFEGALFKDDLVKAYHTSHVLIIPSLFEPWGLVVNEAMSAALPIIASNRVGAVGDLVKPEQTGLIFDPENKQELANCMKRISSDIEFYKKLSHSAYLLMSEFWNYDSYRRELEKASTYVQKKKESHEKVF